MGDVTTGSITAAYNVHVDLSKLTLLCPYTVQMEVLAQLPADDHGMFILTEVNGSPIRDSQFSRTIEYWD